jgi:hypothetical protein
MQEALEHESAATTASGRKWVLLTLAFFVLLATLVGAYLYWNSDRRWIEAVAEADRQDPGWHFNDLLEALPLLPDSENSALVVIKAKGLIPPGWPHEDMPELLKDLSPESQLNEVQLRRVGEEVEKVQAALAAARPLADMPRGRHPIRYRSDVLSTLLPTVHDARSAAGVLEYDILLRLQEGDAAGAMVSCRGMLNAARSVGDEPLTICQLIRSSVRMQTLRALERILAQGEVAEPALEKMQRLLAEEEAQPLLLIAARGERGSVPGWLSALESGELDISKLVDSPKRSGAFGAVANHVAPYRFRDDLGRLLHFNNRWVEYAKMPVEERLPLIQELETEAKDLPGLARYVVPAAGKITQVFHTGHAEFRCAIAALAAERFRLRHGRWPEALEPLVPEFLAGVPLDPFDGRPLRLRRTQDGVVIYSIGADGRDHEGKLYREGGPRDKTDAGFQLWDADQRRRKPKAAEEAPEKPHAPNR